MFNASPAITATTMTSYAGVGISTSFSYATSSDYRLKDNIRDLELDSGVFIDKLKTRTWEWAGSNITAHGFVAHEVQEITSATVIGEKDGVEDYGDVINVSSGLIIKSSTSETHVLNPGTKWAKSGTRNKIQMLDYSSPEIIVNIVAELKALRLRVAQLEANQKIVQ